MATAAAIDKSLSGGISGLRQHMNNMREAIKEHNAKAEEMEKAKVEVYHLLCRTTGKQHALKKRIEEMEESLERVRFLRNSAR